MGATGASKGLAAGLILASLAAAATARAESPLGRWWGAARVEADPAKPYELRESNGPWLIMACSFSGPDAERQAHDLALELRKRYNLEAFVHKKEFKLDDPNGGRASNPLDPVAARWKYKKFNRSSAEIDEVAVLVGNFASIDDAAAHETLKTLKFAQPKCLKTEDGKESSRSLAELRTLHQKFQETLSSGQSGEKLPSPTGQTDAHVWTNWFEFNREKKLPGPMGHAFITTNPMLPPGYYAPKNGIDELVLRMNKDVTHSLLDCPGKYTVQVAHFMGRTTIDQREIQRIEAGGEVEGTGLAKAAEKAHQLTEALRDKGYEAYEFHDRYASIVTVGSFDSVGTPRRDGKIEINPQVHQYIELFRAKPINGQLMAQTLIGIGFDIQPIPVEVPKRSISRELVRGL